MTIYVLYREYPNSDYDHEDFVDADCGYWTTKEAAEAAAEKKNLERNKFFELLCANWEAEHEKKVKRTQEHNEKLRVLRSHGFDTEKDLPIKKFIRPDFERWVRDEPRHVVLEIEPGE